MTQRERFCLVCSTALLLFGGACQKQSAPRTHPAASQPNTSQIAYRNAANEHGLDFRHQSGHRRDFLFPEIMCGGAALFDMDGDGDLDAYLVQGGSLVDTSDVPGNQLFRNEGDGFFVDVTDGSGAADRGYGMGVAAADCDNDGDTDLYVTNVGSNVLLLNDGSGRFEDATAKAGVGHPGWGTSAAFLDYDADGDLDLYVVNYINWSAETELDCSDAAGVRDYCSPRNYDASAVDVLYRNEGGGRFTDITSLAGIDQAFGNGLGVVCGDFNGDGHEDIFVANDGTENQLWLNHGDETFTDEAAWTGCAVDRDGTRKAGMGVDAVDYDDDGDLDFFVSNLEDETDSYYQNEGFYFTDRTPWLKMGSRWRRYTRFGTGFLDFNNDGHLDLFQANGRVKTKRGTHSPFDEQDLLFAGQGEGKLSCVPAVEGLGLLATGRAAAFGDVNGDGGIDILVVNRDAPAHLLMNVTEKRGNWLAFRVLDEHGRDAIGCTLTGKLGSRTLTRNVRAAYSYCASNDPRIHIGLGDETAVDDVVVRWIDGTTRRYGKFEMGTIHTLRRVGD